MNWRKSGGVRRSLGWISINTVRPSGKTDRSTTTATTLKYGIVTSLSRYEFRSGSFNEDARSRWYFNVVVDAKLECPSGQESIGIDLGLKDTAICSDGSKLEAGRFYRDLEPNWP